MLLRATILLQISFLAICYPVLILTYLGQAAWLIKHPDQVSSTFYASIPFGDGFYWVSYFPSQKLVGLKDKVCYDFTTALPLQHCLL